jgi:hypothetical protein
MSRYTALTLTLTLPALLLATAPHAAALELATLLPAGIPGFGTGFGTGFASGRDITITARLQRGLQNRAISLNGITISPGLDATAGYDSAPNGTARASSAFSLAPSLAVADPLAGFGAYAGLQTTAYPATASQNTTSYTIAAGEAAILPQQTLIAAAALLHAQNSGFQLEPSGPGKPATITGTALRAADDITTGMLIISPELSQTSASSTGAARQTSTETAAGLKLQIIPDGILRLIIYGHATHLANSVIAQNASNYTTLIGLADKAEGLWQFRLLAGLTIRQPESGHLTTIPIAEAAADWMPDALTSWEFTAAHEVDDPERIDTSSYTITQAKISIAHEYLRNVILSASLSVTHAAFFATPLVETITQTHTAIAWRLNPALNLTAAYDFNDRQANHLQAANEHIATLSLAWSL